MTAEDETAPRGKKKGARANREGKPWHRSDGRWAMRLYPPSGTIWKRPRYVYGKTRAECKQNHDAAKAANERGVPDGSGDVMIGDYLHKWLYETLPQYVDAGLMSVTTMDSYRDNAELHIIPAEATGVPTLVRIGLLELNAPMVREWMRALGKKPPARPRRKPRPGEAKAPPASEQVLSPRTVAYCRTILRKALADAIRDEVAGLARNVVDLTDPPKADQRRDRPRLTAAEAAALLVAMAEDSLWCYWLVAFAMGYRRGEGLGMRWADLDLAGLVWTPREQIQRLRGERNPDGGRQKGRLVSRKLKTVASSQLQAIPVSAGDALRTWRTEQAAVRLASPRWKDLDLVFTTRFGTAMEPRNVNRAWEALCRRAGVPEWVTLHDLRHALGSFLLARGVDSKNVQRTLRHSRLATTELYLHAIEEVPRKAADATDDLIAELRAVGREGRK